MQTTIQLPTDSAGRIVETETSRTPLIEQTLDITRGKGGWLNVEVRNYRGKSLGQWGYLPSEHRWAYNREAPAPVTALVVRFANPDLAAVSDAASAIIQGE